MAPRLEKSHTAAAAASHHHRHGRNLLKSVKSRLSPKRSLLAPAPPPPAAKNGSEHHHHHHEAVVSHIHSLGSGSWSSEKSSSTSTCVVSSAATATTTTNSQEQLSACSRVLDFHRAESRRCCCAAAALDADSTATTTKTSSTFDSCDTTTTTYYCLGAGWSDDDVQAVAETWNLTAEQTAQLQELGERLHDLPEKKNTADHVIRFLFDKQFNIKAAETQFRNMIAWRQKMGADDILANHQIPQEVLDNVPGALLQGKDLEGDLVIVDICSKADSLGIIQRYGSKTLVQHSIYTRELIARQFQQLALERGTPTGRMLVISDMSGLCRRHVHAKVLSTFGQISRLDQDNYPGVAKRIFVINASTMYRIVWSLVKHFLDPHVAEMITVCDDNYRDILAQHVDLKVLPSAIVPEGEGAAVEGMCPYWKGGLLPPAPARR